MSILVDCFSIFCFVFQFLYDTGVQCVLVIHMLIKVLSFKSIGKNKYKQIVEIWIDNTSIVEMQVEQEMSQ